jgi:hypothetical protein
MAADLGPVFYPDLRPRRPLYLSGVDHEVLRRLQGAGHDVGLLAQPASYGPAAVARYRSWGLDNGCFSAGDRFDACEWVRWLASFESPGLRWGNWGVAYESRLACPDEGPMPACGCLFAAAPDVPFDSAATWARSQPWFALIRRLGFPVALVAQNGIEDDPRAWDEIDSWDCLFLGGDSAWKESQAAAECAREARLSGKWVHAGRVNSRRRLRRLAGHVDSVDGTYLAFGPDRNIVQLARWLDELATQPTLL